MFIDTHAHLSDPAFKGKEDEVIKKAKESMVCKIITSGFDIPSSEDALALAQNYDNVFCSIGVYPEFADSYDNNAENLLFNMAKNKKVVAIGEIGLQYTDDCPSHDKQKEVFIKQLHLACRANLPIVIHCREAYGDMINILRSNRDLIKFGGTLHCYSGCYEIAKEAIKLGLYISVGGVSTFKNASIVKEMLSKVPLESIILETDCPYLAPHPYRGSLNMPSYIPTIAQNLAEIKGVDIERVAEITTKNAQTLFKI